MAGPGTILGHLAPIPHDADEISYDNSVSGLTAADVQAAIDELLSNTLVNLDGGSANSVFGGVPASPIDGGDSSSF
jgi:hypothetical protein